MEYLRRLFRKAVRWAERGLAILRYGRNRSVKFIERFDGRRRGCLPLYDAFSNTAPRQDGYLPSPIVVTNDSATAIGAVSLCPSDEPNRVRILVLAPFEPLESEPLDSELMELLRAEAERLGVQLDNADWMEYINSRLGEPVNADTTTASGKFLDLLESKYPKRVRIQAFRDPDECSVFPIVFEEDGKPTGILAMFQAGRDEVKIHMISSFVQGKGHGTRLMEEVCRQADREEVMLTLEPMPQFKGTPCEVSEQKLREWYERFGFEGIGATMRRRPAD